MQKAIELAQRMCKELEKNWLTELELINLHIEFTPLYHLGYSQKIANTIICFIIYAYDNDSSWLDLRKDRTDNKEKILVGLGVRPNDPIYQPILNYQNKEVQNVISAYLINQTDSSFYEAISLYEFASKNLLFANSITDKNVKTGTEVNKQGEMSDTFDIMSPAEMADLNKRKGELLIKASEAREKADAIVEKMKTKFAILNEATQSDFNFTFTDVKKKVDIFSWRDFIKERVANRPE